jgi:putative SOS response-associated peptidase YedK
MCFYYAIIKKNPEKLIKAGIISEKQISIFEDHFLVNGFTHPEMPVISNETPNELSFYKWGLVPKTVRSTIEAAAFLKAYNTLNASSERIFESKIYSNPIINRRCLVLCSGFFEWRMVKGKKIPYYISLKDESLFVFAGVWDRWSDEKGIEHNTYSVLTTDANAIMAQIHNTKKRMPVILTPEKAKRWLSPSLTDGDIKNLIVAIENECLKAYTIKQFLPISGQGNMGSHIIAYYHYPGISQLITDEDKLEFREKPGEQLKFGL